MRKVWHRVTVRFVDSVYRYFGQTLGTIGRVRFFSVTIAFHAFVRLDGSKGKKGGVFDDETARNKW